MAGFRRQFDGRHAKHARRMERKKPRLSCATGRVEGRRSDYKVMNVALDIKQLSGRFQRSEPAMLEFTKRLIAIPSENPPGNQYEGCA